MENPHVLVLMSTYNGSLYLREQLDSILTQKDINIHLLIRDDGSSDETVSIITEYKIANPDTITLIEGDNIGWKRSFLELARIAFQDFSGFGYYAFSDQDDIWLPDKTATAVTRIETLPQGPRLYCSNLYYYKDGIQHGMIRKREIHPTLKGSLIRDYAVGCTVLMNRQLLEILTKENPKFPVAHDHWVYIIANIFGSIYIDHESYILYRQHNNNQIGFKHGFFKVWKRRLDSLSSKFGKHDIEKLAKEIIRIYGTDIPRENIEAILTVANYRQTMKSRLKLLLDPGYTYDKKSNDFWLKIKIISGQV